MANMLRTFEGLRPAQVVGQLRRLLTSLSKQHA